MTALVAEWMSRLAGDGWRGAERVFDRSFYGQGTRAECDSDKTVSAHRLIESKCVVKAKYWGATGSASARTRAEPVAHDPKI